MKGLWILELFKFIADLVEAGRGFLASMLVLGLSLGGLTYAGKSYVDKKHVAGIDKVDNNHDEIETLKQSQQDIVSTLKIMQNTLQLVDRSVQDTKRTIEKASDTVSRTQNKVVEIYRDLYDMKLKLNENRRTGG